MSSSSSTPNTRLDRKSLKQPDEFSTQVSGVFTRMASHSRVWLIGLAVIFLAGIVAAVLMNQRDAREAEANNALFRAEAVLEKGVKDLTPAPPPKAANDKTPAPASTSATTHQKIDVDQKLGDAVAQLKKVSTEYQGTRAAFEAKMALGDLYFDHGEAAKALPWYQAASDGAPRKLEQALALYAYGSALENSGKPAEAIQAYEKGLNLGEAGLKGELLLAIARCHELSNNQAKAKSYYEQVVTQLPNTEYAKTAELLKTQL